MLKRYDARSWQELPTKVVDEDSQAVYFEAKLPSFSYYAITVREHYQEKIAELLPKKEKPMLWPLYVLSLILVIVIANIVYYNVPGVATKLQGFFAQPVVNETTPYHTDAILATLGEQFKYNEQGEVVDTTTEKVLSKQEFAELLDIYRIQIINMTKVSESNLNAMIMALDPEKELVSGIPTQIWDEDNVQI